MMKIWISAAKIELFKDEYYDLSSKKTGISWEYN